LVQYLVIKETDLTGVHRLPQEINTFSTSVKSSVSPFLKSTKNITCTCCPLHYHLVEVVVVVVVVIVVVVVVVIVVTVKAAVVLVIRW
jgi:hypothetical protein